MKVTKTRNKLKIMGLLLTLVMMVSLLGLFGLTASAAEGDACVSTTNCTGAYAKGICSVCGGYQPATLSEDGVYEIGNAGQLLWFAELVNANSTDMLVNKAVEVDAKLTADIDMTGLSWIPIGQNAKEGDSVYSYGFGGTFDGCGHAVSGIDCAVTKTGTSSSSDSPAAGFFGKICGATIRNLIVEGDFSAVYAGTSTSPAARAGGIVAYAYGNTNNRNLIENCGFKGTIYVKGKLMTHAGGVVGYANHSDIKNCWSVATVESGGATYDYIGGFGGNSSSANTYENCYYDSNICALGAYYNGDLSGVTGKTSSDFENGSVCELVGYHSLDENCVCTICGAVEHNNFDIKGFCTVCKAYQPAIDSDTDGVYEISNAGQLFWFANHINTVDRTASAVLVTDIDLENRPWTPIGSTGENNNNFRGVFDGRNHTIKGLYVEGGRAGLGFFGEVRTGTVKNFTIYGEVVVNTEVAYVSGVIGSICGLNSTDHGLERNGAVIQNITSYVNLTAKAHGVGMIGGFVGYANHQSLIENCSWYGTFDAGIYRVDSGAGGFIGKIQENTSEVTIRNCAAYGTIKTNYEKNSFNNTPTIYMGGFLSFSNTNAQTTLENCLFAGKFERGENLTDEARLGAFGTLRSVKSIKNCYYLGDGVLEAVHSDSPLKPGSDNAKITSVTRAQLLSGEVAYKLGEHFGQTLEGENRQSYPVLGGTKVEESQRFEIYGQQLNIGGDLSMKYYVMGYAPAFNSGALYMEFIHNGVKTKVYADEPNADGFYVFVLEGINPQCLGDNIYARLCYNETKVASHGYDEGKEYSVEKNLTNLLEKYKDDAALVALINDTLAYGKAAEAKTGHTSLEGNNYTGSQREIPESELSASPEGDLRVHQATVRFGTMNHIVLMVESKNGAPTVKVGEQSFDVTLYTENSNYYVSVLHGVSATDFDKDITVTISDGTTTVDYSISINDYLYAISQSSTDEKMVNLAKALYNYGVSAEEYAASRNN